jgi:hypothetical protein
MPDTIDEGNNIPVAPDFDATNADTVTTPPVQSSTVNGVIPVRTRTTPPRARLIRRLTDKLVWKLLLLVCSKPIVLLIWLGLIVSCVVWGSYVVYISIFPLSAIARKIAGTSAGKTAFTYGCIIWASLMSGFNVGVLIAWLGPVVTNSATSEEETHQGTVTDVEANIPSQERADSTSTQSTILGALILGIIYATFFLGLMLWISWLTWWIYPAQAIWQRKVWQSDVCQGWDYEIIMDTISYRQLA